MPDSGSLSDLRPYVITNNDGVQYIGLHASEEDCWRIYLGWPTRGEVGHYKSMGYRCYPANVTWRKS